MCWVGWTWTVNTKLHITFHRIFISHTKAMHESIATRTVLLAENENFPNAIAAIQCRNHLIDVDSFILFTIQVAGHFLSVYSLCFVDEQKNAWHSLNSEFIENEWKYGRRNSWIGKCLSKQTESGKNAIKRCENKWNNQAMGNQNNHTYKK